MKETKEFTGKDVDTAVKNACSALGVSKKDLKYEVIVAGTSGIFGIVGRKDAKIKVTLPTADPNQPSAEEMEGIRSIVDEAFGQDTRRQEDRKKEEPKKEDRKQERRKPAPKPEKKQDRPAPKKAPVEDLEEESDQAEEAVLDDASEDAGRWDSTPAPRDTTAPRYDEDEDDDEADDQDDDLNDDLDNDLDTDQDDDRDDDGDDDEDDETDTGEPPVPVSQESIDLGIEALQKMADLITDDAQIEAVTDGDHLTLQITGGNAGILIGRKGQTLDAMQFLVDKIINRQSEARVRVRVDIEGYMETRKANLRQLAFKMAEKAKKTGRPATINQMSAQDRRIVHLALKDDSQVRTQSMGDGYYRRLVIFPKKRSNYRGKRRFKRNDR